MTERPIIFSAPMVRAILKGRKTQTRRIIKPQPLHVAADTHRSVLVGADNHRYRVGDTLWVRETCRAETTSDGDGVRYPADGEWRIIENTEEASRAWLALDSYAASRAPDNRSNIGATVPSIHMPRWASRITLRVTAARVERLHDISEEDAKAEGATPRLRCYGYKRQSPGWSMDWSQCSDPHDCALATPRMAFANYWNHIHGPHAWDANPWVVALTFERVTPDA